MNCGGRVKRCLARSGYALLLALCAAGVVGCAGTGDAETRVGQGTVPLHTSVPYVPNGSSGSPSNKQVVARYVHLQRITSQVVRTTSLGDKPGAMHAWHAFVVFYRPQRAIIGIRDARVAHDMAGEVYRTGGFIRTGQLKKANFWASKLSSQLDAIAFKVTGKHLHPVSEVALKLALLRRAAGGLQHQILNQKTRGVAATLRTLDASFKAQARKVQANQPRAAATIAGLLVALSTAERHHRWNRELGLTRRLIFTLLAAQARAQGHGG